MTLYHLYTSYTPKDPETLRRNQVAQRTWPTQPWVELPVTDEQLPRLWEEEGRRFAYIKDVFDFGCDGKPNTDILAYTNADIHVRADCSAQILAVLHEAGACYAYRRDFGRLEGPLGFAQYEKGYDYCGSDLAAFRVSWWRTYRDEFPDMILGLEAWDPIFRHLVKLTNPGKRVNIRDVIGHERHASYWERAENRYRLQGQIRCRTLAADWLRKHDINPTSHGL